MICAKLVTEGDNHNNLRINLLLHYIYKYLIYNDIQMSNILNLLHCHKLLDNRIIHIGRKANVMIEIYL